MLNEKQTFNLGRMLITPNAMRNLDPGDVLICLTRHASRDWGEVSATDAAENDLSLREGFRLLSAYRDRHGIKIWIITEADRSATIILLPVDY